MRSTTPFQKKVYDACSKVPKGKVTSYRDLAHAIHTKAYRAVGMALNKNPFSPRVPCHRVINADGRLGGFASGLKNKIKLLKKEGIIITDNKIEQLFFHKFK